MYKLCNRFEVITAGDVDGESSGLWHRVILQTTIDRLRNIFSSYGERVRGIFKIHNFYIKHFDLMYAYI
jgi:hypothetical protein